MKTALYLPDDTSGCGQWRGLWPIEQLWPLLRPDEHIGVSRVFPPDPNFFGIQNTVMIQRWTTPDNRQMFDKALLPAARGGMCNIIYNVDDVMGTGPEEIPTFNTAWRHYSKKEINENIKHIISNSDFVLVTTAKIKQYYVEHWGIDPNNIIIMPNLLPRSWAYGLFNKNNKINAFQQMKTDGKIRVGIISSSSHFNVIGSKQTKDTHELVDFDPKTNKYITALTKKAVEATEVEEIPDDFDDIAEVIDKTSNKIDWICIGQSANTSFKKLVEAKKLTVVNQTDIMHYLRLVSSLNLAAIIAPVKDCLFNHCKSDIKYIESAAVGSILYTPDVVPYKEHVPEDQRWTSNVDLISKLYNLAEMSVEEFGNKIQAQYDFIESPTDIVEGPHINNWWLDDNIELWRSIFFMPRKGAKVHLSQIIEEKNKEIKGGNA